MPLNKNDREFIRLVIKEEMSSALAPIIEKNNEQDQILRTHNQTLYGESGGNGINSEIKAIKVKINDLETTKKQIVAWAAAISGTISVAATIIKNIWKGN